MALSRKIANYDELAVGSNHPNLADTHSRAFLIDHDQYGAHKKISYSDVLTNGDGSTLTTGMVVVMTTTTLQYTRTTTQSDPRQVLVVQDSIINGGQGYVAHMGYVADLMVQGAVVTNDFLRTSTTTGRAESAGTSVATGVFAIALSANASGAGTVKALLFGVTLSGGLSTSGLTKITHVNKTADEVVNNSSTLQNDDHLKYTMIANEKIKFVLTIFFKGPSAGDLKYSFTVPAGATIEFGVASGIDATTGEVVEVQTNTATSSGATLLWPTPGTGTNQSLQITGYVTNGATPGDLQYQWAQNAATATDTTTKANSHLDVITGS